MQQLCGKLYLYFRVFISLREINTKSRFDTRVIIGSKFTNALIENSQAAPDLTISDAQCCAILLHLLLTLEY